MQPRELLELAKKPAHGYELIERLSKEGSTPPEPGNFYRMLRSLEEVGLFTSQCNRGAAWDFVAIEKIKINPSRTKKT